MYANVDDDLLFLALGISSATNTIQQHVKHSEIRCCQMGPYLQKLFEHSSTRQFSSSANQQSLHEGPMVPFDTLEGKLSSSL